MEEPKVGEIVQPSTPIRRKDLGQGVVVKVNQPGNQTICVVFEANGGAVRVYDFSEEKLERANVSEERAEELRLVAQNYMVLMAELRSA